ncbi:MAG: PAS domain S-box protein [Verrucomicrobiota bacterium]
MARISVIKGSTKKDESRKLASGKKKGKGLCGTLNEALLGSLEDATALVDERGCIAQANDAWQSLRNDFSWLGSGGSALDEAAFKELSIDADEILLGICSVIQGFYPEFIQEFSVPRAGKTCWLRLRAKALMGDLAGLALLSLQDITERCKAEQDLRESHSLFHRIVEEAGEGVFIYDMEGRFLMHNTTFLNLFAPEFTSLVGKRLEDVFPPQLAQTARSQNELVLATGRMLGYEIARDTPEGVRNLQIQKGVYRNHRSEAVGIIGIARDITERKRAEERLEKSERHFRALIEKSRDSIVILSGEGRITYASPPTEEIFGFALDEVVGTDVFFWLHPEDAQLAMQRFRETIELPEASITSELRILCKDGQWKWIETTATNLLGDPAMQGIVLNVRDISERKKAEQESRRYEAIVESSIDGILSVDLEGKITSWNPGAQRIFGYSEGEMLGVDFKSLTPEDQRKQCNEFSEAIERGKAIRDCETVRLGRGGARIDVSLSLSPILDRDGRFAGVAVIVRDITERRRLEREVLEIADFEKHRIGQDLHDDLCQHLVAISMIGNMLYADLAKLGLPQAENAQQVTQMIRNAVDHARILAKGLSPLNIADGGLMVGLETLVAHTEQMFRVRCRFECPAAVHIHDKEVATHLYRIAQEALHNAVKHSEGSMVLVRLTSNSRAVEVSVSDDGIGLPDPQKRPAGGGMGMHTMQYRARMIGASLEMFQIKKGGTTVLCRLPLKNLTPDA